jgi:hypothetical protein
MTMCVTVLRGDFDSCGANSHTQPSDVLLFGNLRGTWCSYVGVYSAFELPKIRAQKKKKIET